MKRLPVDSLSNEALASNRRNASMRMLAAALILTFMASMAYLSGRDEATPPQITWSQQSKQKQQHKQRTSTSPNAIPSSPPTPAPQVPDPAPFGKPYVPPTKSSVLYPDALPLEERQHYQRSPRDYNITYFREPKPTPSGWWPSRQWIRSCVNRPRNLTEFPSNNIWQDYRLGDCIKKCQGCPQDNNTRSAQALAHWSIGGQYYDQACLGGRHTPKGNETLLDQLVDSRKGQPGYSKPPSDAIVIHLRLGDKIEKSESNVFNMLFKGAEPYANPWKGYRAIKSLYEILGDISMSGARRVIIRGGSHWPQFYQKSKTYAACLQEAAQAAGYQATDVDLGETDADRDFYYLVHARKIIVTLGGFSRLIGHAVLRKGGILYGRYF